MQTGVFAGGVRRLGLVVLLLAASGCEPLETAPEPLARRTHAVKDLNTGNGLSLNGLSLNGLSLNGLSLNGLSLQGLATAEFDAWFQLDPELHDAVMKYLVGCAVPSGESRTYTSPTTGRSWSWTGALGLAPDWSNGRPATLAEQRIISACLAAHVDKYELHISISVQGLSATGVAIPTPDWELLLYSEKEACFFGNLFNAEGIYAGNDGRPLTDRESTARTCALSCRRDLNTQPCAPLLRVEQDCARFCTLDAARRFYVSCSYNGISYPAITTRMLRSDIYMCGDGVCQVTEKCGTGESFDNCGRDCGPCP
ncbi:hypothetical protein ATI61_101475 [Archangium gephyra]|uniref:PPE family protein n=1 Tax=Archangium gephyra TaxID=48 RepID=A0AAC8QB45_9BACT|nr:hypothetical protein [Archangium gephyra]AKJ04435.1 PPE family protein [Archangium gephyra]REG37489.1 hypothetical protein ATI61_101475 [Archangium gephyra]